MRPRTKDRNLPPCVYLKHGSYYLVKGGKWQRLGADLHSALVEYARIMAKPSDGLADLIDKAFPAIVENVADSTSKQYAYSAKLLKEVFADFRPDQVRHGDVVQMMDGFKDRIAIANRMLTVLHLVYLWALDRGLPGIEADPTISVKRFKQQARERLISASEYKAIYAQCAPWLQCVIDLCYLTGQRIGDVLTIEREHLGEEGVYFKQQKTGKQLVVTWTPELRAVVRRAEKETGPVINMTYLLAGRGGKLRAHSNVWRSFKNAAEQAGVANVTLHDLRAMSGTEIDRQGGDATALLGHTDQRTTRIYLRDKSPKLVSGPRKKAG